MSLRCKCADCDRLSNNIWCFSISYWNEIIVKNLVWNRCFITILHKLILELFLFMNSKEITQKLVMMCYSSTKFYIAGNPNDTQQIGKPLASYQWIFGNSNKYYIIASIFNQSFFPKLICKFNNSFIYTLILWIDSLSTTQHVHKPRYIHFCLASLLSVDWLQALSKSYMLMYCFSL